MAEAEKSRVISQLVAQLKAGEIDKSELFDRLSKLTNTPQAADRPEVHEADAAPEAPEAPPAHSTPAVASGAPQGDISDSRAAWSDRRDDGSTQRVLDVESFQALHNDGGEAREYREEDHPSDTRRPTSATPRRGRVVRGRGERSADAEAGRTRASSARRSGRGAASPARSTSGRSGGRATPRRSTGGGAGATATSEECTFQPKVGKLPAFYGSKRHRDDLPFEERVVLWKQLKDEEYQRRRAAEEEKQVEDCTFKPKINKQSRIAAAGRRTSSRPVHTRLYEAGTPRGKSRQARPVPADDDELKECTFKPRINRYSSSAEPVKARYKQVKPKSGESKKAPELEECTFKPKINKPRANMTLAKDYIAAPVFERLSQTRVRDDADLDESADMSPDDSRRRPASARKATAGSGGGGGSSVREGARPVMDMNTFLANSMEGRAVYTPPSKSGKTKPRRPHSAGPGGRSDRKRRNSAGGSSSATVTPQFASFLERQNMMQQKKQENMKDIKSRMDEECTFQPQLDKKSLQMADRNMGDKFLNRLAAHMLRKEHEAVRQKARVAHDPECTFQPKILRKSAKREKRSVVEMSRGDALKRETAQRLMRLQAEQAELVGLTFQPDTNTTKTKWDNVEGRLKVLDDPDGYLERVQKDQKAFSERQRRAMQAAEMKEFAECTFKPQVHDAPAYVKRIAKSYSLTRATNPDDSESSRPDWR